MDDRNRHSTFPAAPPRGAYPNIDFRDFQGQQQPRDSGQAPSAPPLSTLPVAPPPTYPNETPPYPAIGRLDVESRPTYPVAPQGAGVYGQSWSNQPGKFQIPLHSGQKVQESAKWQPPPPTVSPPERANKKALIIGCNYKGTSCELQGCITDCGHIDYMLRTEFGFKKENMRMLTDDGTNFAMPTKANIFSSMDWLVSNVESGDSLFFHFSGHGSQKPDPTGDERDGLNETLLPCDFRRNGQIIDDEVNERLVNRLPKGVYLHAVIDACHSGTAMDLAYYTKSKLGGNIEWRSEGPTRKYKGTCGGIAILFSACADNQVAQDTDSLTGSVYTGAATNAFIESIIKYGKDLSYTQVLHHMHTCMAKLAGKSTNPHGVGGMLMNAIATGVMTVLGATQQTPQISCNIKMDLNERLHI